jgi:integrase
MPTIDRKHIFHRPGKGGTHGATWFLKLAIPPAIRHHFSSKKGKPRAKIVESLHTTDLHAAQRRRDERLVYWHRRFDAARAGVVLALAADTDKTTLGALYADVASDLELGNKLAADDEVREAAARLGVVVDPGSPSWRALAEAILRAQAKALSERLRVLDVSGFEPVAVDESKAPAPAPPAPLVEVPAPALQPAPQPVNGEKFSQAFAAYIAEAERRKIRPTTVHTYRKRAAAFMAEGDPLLSSVTRAQASDFLDEIAKGRTNGTVNQFTDTLAAVFDHAKRRGRFQGDNPFADQRRIVVRDQRPAFTAAELATLFGSCKLETRPSVHSLDSALPWITAIAAYSGMRLEEIAQLSAADIREQDGMLVFDVHTGEGYSIKTRAGVRIVPVHSALVAAGLLRYRDALPEGSRLFPALMARKFNRKVGPSISFKFTKWRRRLALNRKGLCFHSLRHSVSTVLEAAGVAETDVDRLTGHKIKGMSFGTYSRPAMLRLAEVVEQIVYPGVKL